MQYSSWSPETITNSKTTDPNFYDSFYTAKPFFLTNLNRFRLCKNTGFVVSVDLVSKINSAKNKQGMGKAQSVVYLFIEKRPLKKFVPKFDCVAF